jgi:hypothetical protein
VTTSYQFPKGTLGNGDDQANLSQSMFGEDGLFLALHPGCNAWPAHELASHLSVLKTFGPESSALYVQEPFNLPGPHNKSCTGTQGTLYVFDKEGGTIFEEKLNKSQGMPADALSRLRTTMASEDEMTGTDVENEA